MKIWENVSANAKGHMTFGGCDTVDLVNQYGTPLYIMDENMIRQACRAYTDMFKELELEGQVLYASKAFSTLAVYKIVENEGLGVDVVSEGELRTAIAAGTKPQNIFLHGNNKPVEELDAALELGVGRIVIDGDEEIDALAELAAKRQTIANVMLRIKPGVEAHTHEYITTGSDDSKFGFVLSGSEALRAVEKVLSRPNLKLTGLHYHIGSQVFELEPYNLAVERACAFMKEVKEKFGYNLAELNMGGGFGICYTDEDKPIEPGKQFKAMIEGLREQCAQKGLNMPKVFVEPGRSIVGEAAVALYTVGTVKELKGIRTYVSVDGGMADNPRVAMYQAEYSACLANRPNDEKDSVVTVAGRCCETDLLMKDVKLPACKRGDILAVFTAGAYQYAMSSNYNRLRRPAVLLLNDGKVSPIVRRETYEQIMQNDCIPDWL